MTKVVVIGPESTGKSTLCSKLAEYYQTLCCPEYARQYLGTNGNQYTYDTLLTIAKGQVALEDEFIARLSNQNTNQSPVLFIDTDMYVMEVWCEFVFGKCHDYIINTIQERQYHLYLLCNTDLPWVADELREYPDIERRQTLYLTYKSLLINQSVAWIDISGTYKERFEKAVAAVNKIISH